MREESLFIGVDVGSKSVRAGLFTKAGHVLSFSVTPISVNNSRADFYEQNSEEVWKAVCLSVKNVVSSIDKNCVKGIGFDATCSLVVLDEKFQPVSVSVEGNDNYNIIMWMDHRAKLEAEEINSKPHRCLKYVGGSVSLEMEMPKLMWMKRNLGNSWKSAKHFFDLPDYLTFKATNKLSRSLCSLVCKWGFICDGLTKEWDKQFLRDIGLEDLLENNFEKIGNNVYSPGEFVGGLTPEAAENLGLCEGTAVGTSIIDAHAGALALLFSSIENSNDINQDLCHRLGLIGGTSTCHMLLNVDPLFVSGVWGPYLNAMLSNYWLNEGGQSATGSLIDNIVLDHPAAKYCPDNLEVYVWLETILETLVRKERVEDLSLLTKELHVYPDFHGNRSPLADASLKGMICGLTLDNGPESLALLYLATLQALAYGTKDILNKLMSSGHKIDTVLMCGGLSNSKIFIQINADVLGIPVMIPHTKESVLLGSAMLGASASGVFGTKGDVVSVARAMAGQADTYSPNKKLLEYHSKKFEVFKKMQQDQFAYREKMKF